MNKSYILTALGVVGSSLLTINANADTIYMCKTCKAGTYANNNKCETCPAGSYCIDGVKHSCQAGTFSNAGASSCTTCSAGTYSTVGASSCTACEAGYYCTGGCQYACADGTYATAGQSSCSKCNFSYEVYETCSYKYCYEDRGFIGPQDKTVIVYDKHYTHTGTAYTLPTCDPSGPGKVGLVCSDHLTNDANGIRSKTLTVKFNNHQLANAGGCNYAVTMSCNKQSGNKIIKETYTRNTGSNCSTGFESSYYNDNKILCSRETEF